MLKTPAPFPHVGAWALLSEPARDLAVRILERDGADALIAVAGEFAASANRRLPVAALHNADALTPAEKAELAALDASMAGKARPRKADVARARELGDREQRAAILRTLLERQPARHFPAAAAAARELRTEGAAA